MKKVSFLALTAFVLSIAAIGLAAFVRPVKNTKQNAQGYYFAYCPEQQRPEGCCGLAISNVVSVNCPGASAVQIKLDMSPKYAAFYKANYARQYSYLSNPVIAGPYNSADAANNEKDKIIGNYRGMRSVILYTNDFGYGCK